MNNVHWTFVIWAPHSSKVWRIVAVICFWYIAFRKWADTMAPHLNNGTRILFLRGTQANTPPRTQKLWLIFLQLNVMSLWRRTQSFEIENKNWFVKLSKLKLFFNKSEPTSTHSDKSTRKVKSCSFNQKLI